MSGYMVDNDMVIWVKKWKDGDEVWFKALK